MTGRRTLALGLAVGLGAWAGPAHAWVPRPRPSERPVEPAGEQLGAPALEPPSDAGDPVDGVDQDTLDPASDEGDAAEDPSLEAGAPAEPAPDAPVTREPTTTPAPNHDVPADDFEAESGVAPGGYYGHGVILERPPADGRNRIIVGSILVPLGILATVTSAVGTWMSVPSHCTERLGAAGIEATPSRCQGLFTFNVIRTTYGALMLGSGATILALGMIQRERYRKWRREHGMQARVEPMIGLPGRHGASLGLRLRF